METDIGEFTQQPMQMEQEYQPISDGSSQFQYYHQGPPAPQQYGAPKGDILAELGKTAYIIIFVAFILGFFMGKTMQPVILRPN
jgi:hypothetical protein